MKRFFQNIPCLLLLLFACTSDSATSNEDSNSDTSSATNSEIVQVEGNMTNNGASTAASDQLNTQENADIAAAGSAMISFDDITPTDLDKKPLVFSEGGFELELSVVFVFDKTIGEKANVSSAPYSLSGNPVHMKLTDGSSFNVESAMLGAWDVGSTITVKGYQAGDDKYVIKHDVSADKLDEVKLNFKGIDTFSIHGGATYAVVDDIVISK